jgi:hypothetical protein
LVSAPVRGLGNVLIGAWFRLLIGRAPGDLLSGYRVFSRHFLASVTIRSRGFEVETELTSEAIARRLRVVEVPVSYHPRIAGTVSKLRAGRDGLRIAVTIARQGLRLRPGRFALLVLLLVLLLLLLVAVLLTAVGLRLPGGWPTPGLGRGMAQ